MEGLRNQKVDFVSNLLGSSVQEINHVSFTSLVSYLAYQIYVGVTNKKVPLLLDYALNVLAFLLAITIYSSQVTRLHLLIISPFFLYVMYEGGFKKAISRPKSNMGTSRELLPKKSFVTVYRSHMMILTNLSILAVDFKLFPRRFAKVETWGTSLMDLGVGSFVFSMGLVNCRTIIKSSISGSKSASNFGSYSGSIFHSIKKSMPILILGIIRCISVKSLEYQEHVTEYGIHWNFFITLGLLPIFLAALDPVLAVIPRPLVALILMLAYEVSLKKYGYLKYILSSENRLENIFTMNKEGIASFIGYLSIFLMGQSIGMFTLTGFKTPYNLVGVSSKILSPKKVSKNASSWKELSVSTTWGLLLSSLFYWCAFNLISESSLFLNVSRRLANLAYVLWVIGFNSSFLLFYNIISKLEPSNSSASGLLEAINKNSLLCFLVANLLTGLVNMKIDTLNCGSLFSLCILVIYSLVWCALMIILDKKHIYIKL